jgi:hypothetical protein
MVDGASGVRAYFGDRTGIEALGHNGLFHVPAWLLVRLETLPISRLLFRQMDFNIPAARQDCGVRRGSIGALDLEQLRFILGRLADMRFNLERKTDRIGAAIVREAHIPEEQRIESGPLRASGTGTRFRQQSCVVLIERRILEDQEQVALNPVCKLFDRHLNIDILAIGPNGRESFSKRPFLLVRRELGYQERVPGADTVGKERVGYGRDKIDQAQTLIYKRLALADTRGDSGNVIPGRLHLEQRMEADCLFHRVDIFPLQVLDCLGLDDRRIAQRYDADGHGFERGNLGGPEPPRPCNHFVLLGCEFPNQ